MNTKALLLLPLAFAAGVSTLVLLQAAGFVEISASRDPQSNRQLGGQSGGGLVSGELQRSGSSSSSKNANAKATLGVTADASTSESTEQSLVESLLAQVDDLKTQVQEATVQRDVMRQDLQELREQNEQLLSDTAALFANNEFLPRTDGANVNGINADTGLNDNNANAQMAERINQRRGFGIPDSDEQYASLVAAGIDENIASGIKQRIDQWSLERLELIDQAVREGWRDSDQFSERMSALRDQRPDLRSELSDTEYEEYLYASGDSNRVQVVSIIDGSAAQLAGMVVGDLILSYADQRIFSARDVQDATREGSRGELVLTTIERDGQLLSLEIPRGPLGVSLNGLRVPP